MRHHTGTTDGEMPPSVSTRAAERAAPTRAVPLLAQGVQSASDSGDILTKCSALAAEWGEWLQLARPLTHRDVAVLATKTYVRWERHCGRRVTMAEVTCDAGTPLSASQRGAVHRPTTLRLDQRTANGK